MIVIKRTQMFFFVSWVIFSVVFSACATVPLTYDGIQRDAESVNLSDGVNTYEAVFLARKHLSAAGLSQNHKLEYGHVKYFDKQENLWAVNFPSRYGFLSGKGYQFTMQVWVDASTGEIKSSHICKY